MEFASRTISPVTSLVMVAKVSFVSFCQNISWPAPDQACRRTVQWRASDRGMKLASELETGDAPIPRSRPVKGLSGGELAELRAVRRSALSRLNPALEGGPRGGGASSPASRTGHGAFATTTGNAITRPAVEPLPHRAALRGGFLSSPSLIWPGPTAITSCWCGPRISGRRAFFLAVCLASRAKG